MTPVVLGALIYGAITMFAKHPTEPHNDAKNATDLLNATIHTASVIATSSWHHTTALPPKATQAPDQIINAPSSETKDSLQTGRKPQEDDDEDGDDYQDYEEDDGEEEEEEETNAKALPSHPNHHSEDQKGGSTVATMHKTG